MCLKKFIVGLLLCLVSVQVLWSVEVSQEDLHLLENNLVYLETNYVKLQDRYRELEKNNEQLNGFVLTLKESSRTNQESLTQLSQSLEKINQYSMSLSENYQKQLESLETVKRSLRSTQLELTTAKTTNFLLWVTCAILAGVVVCGNVQ